MVTGQASIPSEERERTLQENVYTCHIAHLHEQPETGDLLRLEPLPHDVEGGQCREGQEEEQQISCHRSNTWGDGNIETGQRRFKTPESPTVR